ASTSLNSGVLSHLSCGSACLFYKFSTFVRLTPVITYSLQSGSNCVPKAAAPFARMGEYIELTKPRITWLILMSTGVGYFFGARSGWHWLTLLHTVIGTALIASGTAALNQWYEREADSKMRRTMARPLPSGRIAAGHALWFASVLSAL